MKKTKYQKTCLKIAIVCLLISGVAAWGMVDIVMDSYGYDFKIIEGESMKIFGPKAPKGFDWEYEDRFQYKSWKETINV